MHRDLALSSSPSPSTSTSTSRTPALVGLAAWLAIALGIALSESITLERRFLIPISLGSLLATQVVLYRRGGSLRALADGLDTRTLLAVNTVRAPIGIAFLFLMSHGLDGTFARIAGVGDLLAGSLALVLATLGLRSGRAVLSWNVLGFLDLIAVVFTAQRILLLSDHPQTMGMLVHFPGLLLPTFLVPLILAVHLLVFARLRRAGARAEIA